MAVKGRSISSWIFSVFRSRDKFLLITLYKSLVRSHLEYCCPVWHPWNIGEIQQLENVQRAFTRKITNVSHLHYWDRLKKLGLMSLQRRRERFLIVTMGKIMNNQCTNEVGIIFIFNNPSRLGIKAQIPPLSKSSTARNQAIRDHSLSVIGPKL